MDIDSNFEDDYNTVNALKNNKKKEPKNISKKKVTFDCSDNSSNEESFNYEHDSEDESDEDILDDEFEGKSLSGEETLDEDNGSENMSNEEHFGNDDDDDTFDYNHEEEFNYDDEKEEKFSDGEPDEDEDEDLLDNNDDTKTISTKEDIYGRIRKSDGTIMASYLNEIFPINKIISYFFICFNNRNSQ